MAEKASQDTLSTSDKPPSPNQPEILSPDEQEVGKILRSFKIDPMGVISLGEDGILRSLTADRAVVDAAALPPRLIKAYLDRLPYCKELEDKFRGVDGMKTPKAQWFDPDRSILPEPLSEEHREEARKMIEERELLAKEGKEIPRGKCNAPIIRSNYNLGINE